MQIYNNSLTLCYFQYQYKPLLLIVMYTISTDCWQSCLLQIHVVDRAMYIISTGCQQSCILQIHVVDSHVYYKYMLLEASCILQIHVVNRAMYIISTCCWQSYILQIQIVDSHYYKYMSECFTEIWLHTLFMN